MSCKHCEMRDVPRGSVTWTEGEPFEHPPFHSAYIEQEFGGFWLHVEKRGWHEGDDYEHASTPIRHCPWCGEPLGDAPRGTLVDERGEVVG